MNIKENLFPQATQLLDMGYSNKSIHSAVINVHSFLLWKIIANKIKIFINCSGIIHERAVIGSTFFSQG